MNKGQELPVVGGKKTFVLLLVGAFALIALGWGITNAAHHPIM